MAKSCSEPYRGTGVAKRRGQVFKIAMAVFFKTYNISKVLFIVNDCTVYH